MADASSVATAIPREINLGLQKPVATPAYTRRFKSNASNPLVSAGSQVTITLDTAQPGSFIDTLSSYLSFRLELVNTSTTSGYNASFSSCGAHALIRAMRIYVQGVPIEEITEYNALVEWLHDLAGIPDYCDRSAKGKYLANTMMGDQCVYVPPATVSGGTTVASVKQMNIQLPLISGVLGTMAEKMFPSMLVAPGNCYIQLDIAQAAHALRVVEVDVSSMLVGTNPLQDGAAAAIGLPRQPDAVTGATSVAATAEYQAASDVTTLSSQAVLNPSANLILEDGPFDAPFGVGAGGTNAKAGILSTEERIGGGMFWAGAGEYAATAPDVLRVADTVGPARTTGTSIDNISNTATPTEVAKIFLGSGMDATGGTATGRANLRCTPSSGISLTFNIRELEFIGKQVVVGDDVARAIIERAAAGDISIHTQSYRQYPATISLNGKWNYRVDPAYSNINSTAGIKNGAPLCNMYQRYISAGGQSLIIPAKISSANALYHIFRNGAGDNDFRFDSLRRMTIGMSDNPLSGQISAQLRIGNELIPQSPISSASEALEELLKAHHMGGYYGTCEKMGSIVASAQQYVWPTLSSYMTRRGLVNALAGGPTYDPIGRVTVVDEDGLAANASGGVSYVRNDYNSQILTVPGHSVSFKFPTFGKYDRTSVGTTFTGVLSAAASSNFYQGYSRSAQNYRVVNVSTAGAATDYVESQEDYANRQRRWKEAVKKAFFGYASERSDHQCTDPTKPNFLNPYKQHAGRYSTFMLGFDLDTFSHNTDVVRSGHYLGNNTVSLNLSNMEIVDNSPLNMPLCNSVRVDTFVLHDLRLSFQAGGIVQAFY